MLVLHYVFINFQSFSNFHLILFLVLYRLQKAKNNVSGSFRNLRGCAGLVNIYMYTEQTIRWFSQKVPFKKEQSRINMLKSPQVLMFNTSICFVNTMYVLLVRTSPFQKIKFAT